MECAPLQQGLAHLVEHVTFLGSKKRDAWLGSGTRGNAYTDFHHTVFHIHSPTNNKDGTYMLPNVLDILYDVAFNPSLLDTRIAKVGVQCSARQCKLHKLHPGLKVFTPHPVSRFDT